MSTTTEAAAWDEGFHAGVEHDLGDYENAPDPITNPYRAASQPVTSPPPEAQPDTARMETLHGERCGCALPWCEFRVGYIVGWRDAAPGSPPSREAAQVYREIRARLAGEDVPIHVAADIEQIICETGGDFGE